MTDTGTPGVLAGFPPSLSDVLGNDSFNEANGDRRFQALLRLDLPLCRALRAAWRALQAEVGENDADGPLRASVEAAGYGFQKLQKALTAEREAARFQALGVEIRALQASDMRRNAWLNLDRFSTVWITALPAADVYL